MTSVTSSGPLASIYRGALKLSGNGWRWSGLTHINTPRQQNS